MKNINSIKKLAFTLAEVLIVLGIVGIIAEMTIPTIMQNINQQNIVVSLKKNYSALSQVYNIVVQEDGTPDNWMSSSNSQGANSLIIMQTFLSKMKVAKDCQTNTSSGCFSPGAYLTEAGADSGWMKWDDRTNEAKAILADGTSIMFFVSSPTCTSDSGNVNALHNNVCGWFGIDINGEKPPKKLGSDFFFFWLTKQGIVPMGTPDDVPASFDTTCKDKSTAPGLGCAAWVIYNENLDYLKCSNLSWNGATKCP